jgi:hypothetical protein
MPRDRNTLLGVLAVARGLARPAEVIAAQQAVAVDPRRTLVKELQLSPDGELELEEAAQEALLAANGNVQKAIAANGGARRLESRPALQGEEAEEETSIDGRPVDPRK